MSVAGQERPYTSRPRTSAKVGKRKSAPAALISPHGYEPKLQYLEFVSVVPSEADLWIFTSADEGNAALTDGHLLGVFS